MPSAPDLQPVLTFLTGLKANNNKPWFEAHRPAYEKAKAEFEDLVDQLILGLRAFEDLGPLTARDCVMRIYRDIRFSPNKSPYKYSLSADIVRGGRSGRMSRAPQSLGYYIHLEPHNQSLIAGGLYMPETVQLNRFRAAIARHPRDFKFVINEPTFKRYFGEVEGEKLKTAPQGYDRSHPEIELLRLKQVTAVHHLTDQAVLAPNFPRHALKTFEALKPFLDYLNSVLAP